MRTLNLDRFEVGLPDPQNPTPRYRGLYDDPYDDPDWMELSEEDKKRRARFGLDEEEDE